MTNQDKQLPEVVTRRAEDSAASRTKVLNIREEYNMVAGMHFAAHNEGYLTAVHTEALPLLEALEALLPEVYCLYSQAGHGRLDKCHHQPEGCIVKRKYDTARNAIRRFNGEGGEFVTHHVDCQNKKCDGNCNGYPPAQEGE